MANNLSIFEGGKLPGYLSDWFAEESNIAPKASVPHLGIEGKVWSINIDGEKTKLMKKDADGDEMPMSVMRVVILDYNDKRGRAYYEGGYDPSKPGKPVCWSDDGVKADASVVEPPCKGWTGVCSSCPLSVKGSKVNENGKATVACGSHRLLAVVPANKLDFTPMRLKLSITSDWDVNSPDLEKAGWFAFSNYTDWLRARGCTNTAGIVTKMKFDPNTAYPKIVFSPDRVLEPEEVAVVRPIVKSEAVQKLLKSSFTPAGETVADAIERTKATKASHDEDDEDTPLPPKKAAKPAPVDDDEDEAPAPKKAAKKAAPPVDDDEDEAPAPKKAAKPAPVDDDEDEAPAPKKAARKAEGKASPKVEVPEDVAGLLDEWSDD